MTTQKLRILQSLLGQRVAEIEQEATALRQLALKANITITRPYRKRAAVPKKETVTLPTGKVVFDATLTSRAGATPVTPKRRYSKKAREAFRKAAQIRWRKAKAAGKNSLAAN
jgi:hypothetical protein